MRDEIPKIGIPKIPKMEVATVWQMCYSKREGESQRSGLPSIVNDFTAKGG